MLQLRIKKEPQNTGRVIMHAHIFQQIAVFIILIDLLLPLLDQC